MNEISAGYKLFCLYLYPFSKGRLLMLTSLVTLPLDGVILFILSSTNSLSIISSSISAKSGT